jgi:hypothetical protein
VKWHGSAGPQLNGQRRELPFRAAAIELADDEVDARRPRAVTRAVLGRDADLGRVARALFRATTSTQIEPKMNPSRMTSPWIVSIVRRTKSRKQRGRAPRKSRGE